MAGEEDLKQHKIHISSFIPFSFSLLELTLSSMEESVKKCCWRKEVNENLKRVHSLLFGAENCRDADSRSHSETDKAFIQHIRTQALSYPHTARKSLTPIVNCERSATHGLRRCGCAHAKCWAQESPRAESAEMQAWKQDFKNSLQEVRPSVSPNELGTCEQWNKQFGSLAK